MSYWIYTLTSPTITAEQHEEGPVLGVVGFFAIHQNSIEDGQVFFLYEDKSLRYRGTWQAQNVTCTSSLIAINFNMTNDTPCFTDRPRRI